MFATFVTVIMQGKSCNRGGHKGEESNERQARVELRKITRPRRGGT